MDLHNLGRVLVVVGFIVAILGGLLMLAGRTPLFNLPGDIRIQREGFSCVVPIVSSIIISIVLTIVLNIIIRLINRP